MLLLTQHVLRLSDRFIDSRSPESLDRQERLLSCITLVSIFYLVLSIALVRLSSLERPRHAVLTPTDIAFELAAAPPEPKNLHLLPAQIELTPDMTAESRHKAQMLQAKIQQAEILSDNSSKKLALPASAPYVVTHNAQPIVCQRVAEEAPINTTSTNPIKIASFFQTPTIPDKIDATRYSANTPTNNNPAQSPSPANDKHNKDSEGPDGSHQPFSSSAPQINQSGSDLENHPIPTTLNNVSRGKSQGNIKPYKDRLTQLITNNWHSAGKNDHLVLLLVIDKSGQLLDASILESGGKKADRRALDAAAATAFEPLPDWYSGESLAFRIVMSR